MVGVRGEGVEKVWQRVMNADVKKLVSFLEWIDSVVFFQLSVRLVDYRGSGDSNEEFLDDLNLRSDVWGSVGSMEF